MSPQRSNRQLLLDGALRCLERLPAEHITARAIADESGANLASIGYHFGSKEALLRAEQAHAQHQAQIGREEPDWPTWYAQYFERELAGHEASA